jgi:hypothetical protein
LQFIFWIPAFAGMTTLEIRAIFDNATALREGGNLSRRLMSLPPEADRLAYIFENA